MKINYQKKLFKPIPTKQNTCRARRIKQQIGAFKKRFFTKRAKKAQKNL
jgi:hypothetical protein